MKCNNKTYCSSLTFFVLTPSLDARPLLSTCSYPSKFFLQTHIIITRAKETDRKTDTHTHTHALWILLFMLLKQVILYIYFAFLFSPSTLPSINQFRLSTLVLIYSLNSSLILYDRCAIIYSSALLLMTIHSFQFLPLQIMLQ